MKKIVLLLMLAITSNFMAQTYHPFPDSSAIWRIEDCFDESPFCGFLCTTPYCLKHSIFIAGDTLIDSNTYHKLYRSDVTASDTLYSNYVGLIREVNKKVYIYIDSVASNNEFYCMFNTSPQPTNLFRTDLLLYDFSVAVGDTVLYDYMDSLKLEITAIDSILISNQYRKQFHYNPIFVNFSCNGFFFNFSSVYIEGIGTPLGILGELSMFFEHSQSLLCFEDAEITYPSTTNCINAVGINDKTPKANTVAVYPNPNNGIFTLQIETPFNQAALTVFDATGKQIIQQNIAQTETRLNLLAYPKGMYFYHLIIEGKLVTGKVVRE